MFENLYSRVSSPDFFVSSDVGLLFSGGSPYGSTPGSFSSPVQWSTAFSSTTPTTSSSALDAFHVLYTFQQQLGPSSPFPLRHPRFPSPAPVSSSPPGMHQQFLNSSSSQVLDASGSPPGFGANHPSTEQRWRAWVDAEARRRLLAACFLVDVHTSIFHEQARVRHFDLADGQAPPIPLTGSSAPLWEAPAAQDWAVAADEDPTTLLPAFFPDWSTLTADEAGAMPAFDRALVLAAEAARLPKRTVLPRGGGGAAQTTDASAVPTAAAKDAERHIADVFGSCPVGCTYLALHHTPLLDLLAVSGDSWVFSHKVLPADSFLEHQKRLKAWADAHLHQYGPASAGRGGRGTGGGGSPLGMSAARATVYAARALCAFLARGDAAGEAGGARGWMADISEYWAAYVCGLIIWAFGHRLPSPSAAQRAAGGGSGSGGEAKAMTDDEAAEWLRGVAEMGEESAARVRGRREAGAVVGLVRRRLETECVGGRNRLFVDAVGVLKKLEEGINWKWF